jgi:hypothetical protein
MSGRGHGDKLSGRQEQAIAALLSERTVEDAAAKVPVGYRTLKGWLALPAFQDAYRRARADVLERTVGRLLSITGKAVDTLEALLDGAHAGTRARAAVAILDHATRGVELLDLDARLRALEERQGGGKP